MAILSKSHSATALMLFVLTGCAAPIKALMNESAAPVIDRAALQAADEQETKLRAALMEKGKSLLNARGRTMPDEPATPKAAKIVPASVPAPAARVQSPGVSAMLARAKGAEPPRPPKAALEPIGLVKNIRVKDETRLKDSPTGSPERRPDHVVIRFEPGVTSLDAAGNRALAELARRSELAPAATIVLVAGLSGRGTPWERMQVASERLEVVARHVPPPLRVERKFEIELEGQHMRLELHRGAR